MKKEFSKASAELAQNKPSFVEHNTPLPGFLCKTKDCAGNVQKTIAGANAYGYFYRVPVCSICGRKYFCADDSPVVGVEKFEKCMNAQYGL